MVSAVLPLPISSGVASEVKFARDGFQVPSCETCGATGQWQNPFGYFPTRSQRSRRCCSYEESVSVEMAVDAFVS